LNQLNQTGDTLKRLLAAVLIAVFGASSLTACSVESGIISGTELSVAQIGELNSINPDVSSDLTTAHNASELANLTTSKFFNLGASGELIANEKLGTVEASGTKQMRVTYTLSETATWSDGVAIDATDLALSFAAATSLGGSNFYSIRRDSGLQFAKIASKPKVGDRSLTLQFSAPVADYKTALTLSVAAHTVAGKALDTPDSAAAKTAALNAIINQDVATLEALAETYRSSFDSWQGITDETLFVSSGAYRVAKVSGKTSVELLANENYQNGHLPRAQTVTLKYFGDATAAIAAMSSGEVDIATAEDSGIASLGDILGLVSTIKSPKVSSVVKSGASTEQVIFNFRNTSVFSTEANNQDPAQALVVRKAFLNLIPKNRIITGLSQNYSVVSSDSLVFSSGMNYYDSSVSENGLSEYLFQDVEKASELMASTNLDLPRKVRVVFDTDNPRAQVAWILLRERALSAGFKLKDLSSQDPTEVLASGEFDVYIGARPVVSLPSENVFAITSSAIFGYTSPAVDAALEQLALASDERDRGAALAKLDKLLVADAYGMPLYEVPSLLVYTDRIRGFVPSAFADSATWGYQNWAVEPASQG
jgi:peptide/nickel transport system substrate-binding protein